MPNKYAVLVGCDYPQTAHELHGCVQDALRMQGMLINRFGFNERDIDLLIDSDERANLRPTGENIRKALIAMVGRAQSESDVLFFHYSGHSTLFPVDDTPNYEECIVPCDFNLLTAEDFRFILKDVHPGATFTLVFDTGVSGGLIDKDEEQIDPPGSNILLTGRQMLEQRSSRRMFLPLDSLVDIFRELSNDPNMEADGIKTFLNVEFRDTASYTVRRLLNQEVEIEHLQAEMGILLSGCKTDETCTDVWPDGEPRGYGAFTNAILTVLEEERGNLITNRELVLGARNSLEEQGFLQHPCLYCSDRNADSPFPFRRTPGI